jgi:4-amino-4-deoxy-L-arabinose transferase-like glycosyltransferase
MFHINSDTKRDALFLLALSLAIMVLGVTSIREKSLTWDEPWYVGAGYYLAKTGNFHTDAISSHPPLPYYINSIPLFALDYLGMMPPGDPAFTTLEENKSADGCYFCYVNTFVYRLVYGEQYRGLNLLFLSRITMLFVLVLCSIYMFRLSKEYFGFGTACVLTTLLALNPNILAHASLATTDIAPVCFNLISFYYFNRFMESKTPSNCLKTGISLGLALLSKESSLYLIPVYATILVIDALENIRRWKRMILLAVACALIGVVALTTLNAAYGFKEMKLSSGNVIDIPLSEYYGFINGGSLQSHLNKGHSNYLAGEAYDSTTARGMDYLFKIKYWATVAILKNPEGILALFLIALVYYLGRIFSPIGGDRRMARLNMYLTVNLAVFMAFAIQINILIGIRLVLFIYPIIFLLMGEPVKKMLSANQATRKAAYALLVASLIPTLIYYPHYLAYFNQLIGGPQNGYKYLTDSNLDWGQDLPGLKSYMAEHNIRKIKLAYFGRDWIDEYKIKYVSLPNNQNYLSTQRPAELGCGPTKGMLAISATSLSGQYGNPDCYRWLQNTTPVANIGYSILVYNISGSGQSAAAIGADG